MPEDAEIKFNREVKISDEELEAMNPDKFTA